MTTRAAKLTCDEVLESFAMERHSDGRMLQRYLKDYPEYATQLVDLSQEIFRSDIQVESPLSAQDQMRIDTACSRIQSVQSSVVVDPFADLPVSKLREVALVLNVPRQVITAFRERTVIVATVPKRFLTQLASLVGSSVQDLLNVLALPPAQLVRSYKADEKPTEVVQVTFEQLLRGTNLTNEQIEVLLTDDI